VAGEGSNNSALALGRLRELIRARASGGDGRLPTERELAESLGLGRRAVRRALEVLEAEGRIWRRQGKGTFIGARPGEPAEMARALGGRTNLYEVMEARLRLEPQLAFLAALKASDAEVVRMRHLCARVAESDDADGRELWDGALHRQIARATGNRLLLALFDVVDQIRQSDSWTALRERARRHGGHQQYLAQHAAIVDAIAARDPGAAEQAMRRHIMALQQNLILAAEGEASAAE
jgi:GntR family transcriptional repressor for pyruvate dehydrogenase complex